MLFIRPIAYTDRNGNPCFKQQLVDSFSVVDNVSGISIATLQPQQSVEVHAHSHGTMHEFFYVLKGHGIIMLNHLNHDAKAGLFVHAAPGEPHAFYTHDDQMKMLNVGVTIGSKWKPA
jgi:quercetin dioxygenase-like cupin family protein